jgi:hypothetical protein
MPIIHDWAAATGGQQGEVTNDGRFGNSQTTLRATLKEMAVEAWNDSLGKGIDPSGKLAEFISRDGRFSEYDPHRLAVESMDRVRKGGSRNIDLDGTRRDGSRRYLDGRRGLNHRSLG